MKKPNIIGNVFIAGDVEIGENVSFFHGASIRGDVGKISIGNCSNVQDNATVHCNGIIPTIIGDYVSIGHNAVVHSANIGNNCIIGMGAILLNGCEIGENCIIGAGAVITQNKKIPQSSIVVGNPCKILKSCTSEDILEIKRNAETYMELGENYANQKYSILVKNT